MVKKVGNTTNVGGLRHRVGRDASTIVVRDSFSATIGSKFSVNTLSSADRVASGLYHAGAGVGGVLGGSVALGAGIYQGKDWSDIGLDTLAGAGWGLLQSAARGYVRGYYFSTTEGAYVNLKSRLFTSQDTKNALLMDRPNISSLGTSRALPILNPNFIPKNLALRVGLTEELSMHGVADVAGNGLRSLPFTIQKGQIRRPINSSVSASFKRKELD